MPITESGIDITSTVAGTENTGAVSAEPTSTPEFDLGAAPTIAEQPGNVAPEAQAPTPNSVAENANRMVAESTRRYQEVSAKEAALQAREQAYQAQQSDIETMRAQNAAAQAMFRNPVIRQALALNVESIADGMIQQGLVQPHQRQALITEIRQMNQDQQAPVQQQQQQQYPPQFDQNQFRQQMMEELRGEQKRLDTSRKIDEQTNQVKSEFRILNGRDATSDEIMDIMQFAVQMVNDPLAHVLKAQNFQKYISDAEARTRRQVQIDMRNGADPFGGAVLPVESDPEIDRMMQDIRDARP